MTVMALRLNSSIKLFQTGSYIIAFISLFFIIVGFILVIETYWTFVLTLPNVIITICLLIGLYKEIPFLLKLSTIIIVSYQLIT